MISDTLTPLQILKNARALIGSPDRWCQQSYGQTAGGQRVWDATDPDAVRWCSAGAISRCASTKPFVYTFVEESVRLACKYLTRAAWEQHPNVTGELDMILYVNDKLDHPAVLNMFDRAIVIAESLSAHPS